MTALLTGVQRGPGLAGVGGVRYAAKPCHIRAAGKRINHAHQAARRRLWDPPILLPNEIVRPAVGDQDNASRSWLIHGRSGAAIMRNFKLLPGWIRAGCRHLSTGPLGGSKTCTRGLSPLISDRAHLVSFLAGNRDVWRFWPALPSGEPRKERGESRWKNDQQRHEEKQVDK
jgi:hypothetical protein